MVDKDVEKQLEEEAAKLKMKDFSERWEVIKDKIHPTEDEVYDKVLCEQKVAVSTYDTHSESSGVKKKALFYSGLVVLLILVCLAIALPIVLRKPQERFLQLEDLNNNAVTQIQFEEALQSSDLQTIDFSEYELDEFFIYTSDDDKVVGGKVNVIDFETESLIKLLFYSSNVKSWFEVSEDCQNCTVNGVKIKYLTSYDDVYTTVAIADSGKVIYELTCMTGDDNVTAVFERLFGNN